MHQAPRARLVQRLAPDDLVAVAECILIDADAFPYASSPFGLRDAAGRAWIAREDQGGHVVGFVAGRVRRRELHIDGIAVRKEARRLGAGRSLVRACIQDSAAEGLECVTLNVAVSNHPAVALYRSEGFATRQRLIDFYPPGVFEGERSAYEMVRPL
jgi:ribosomal protein S18 acetylase RimI-like enzyme